MEVGLPEVSRRGRPRDPAVESALLSAALELLAENGYAGLKVQEVADRAGTSLGALYRRWPTKRELVLAAVLAVVPSSEPELTDDPVADLTRTLIEYAKVWSGPQGQLLGAVLSEIQADQDFAFVLEETLTGPMRRLNRDLLRRVIGDAPDLDIRADVAPALIFLRGMVFREPLGDEEIRTSLVPMMTRMEAAP